MSAAVQTVGLRKEFSVGWFRGRVLALEGLDMEVHRGEVFGLLGPNGSEVEVVSGVKGFQIQ